MSMYSLIAALFVLGTAAAPTQDSISTSVTSQKTCITRLRPSATSLSSVPTSTRTSSQTESKTITLGSASDQQKTKTFTPSAVTSTVIDTASLVSQAAVEASSTTIYLTVTESDATNGGSCASTVTVTADGTSTVYTGTYSANAAKRTVNAQHISLVKKRQNSFANLITHRFGEPMSMMSRQAFEVDCLEQLTTYLIATSTISGAARTTTVTASTPTVYITQTANETSAATLSVPVEETITSTITQTAGANNTSAAVCTVTSGTPSATTTQHLKCAPTNLIGSANGYGIAQTQGHANETEGLTDGSDPSACCQTCVDTEGCAASSDDQGAGNCFLFYTTPSCGLGFAYTDGGEKLAAGSGLLVQTGCGTVEVAAS